MKIEILEVKDLSLATYLYSLSEVQFLGKRRLANGEVFFQFTPKDKAESLIKRYWNLTAPSIQPKVLFNSLRDLKDMIFGQ